MSGRHARPVTRGPARGSATVAGWTLVSRATGLVRLTAIGAVLGPTYFANTFQSTNTIPNITYSTVAGPVLGLVVVPAVVSATTAGRTDRAVDLLGRVSGALLAASGVVALGLVLLSPAVALVLTAGIPDPAVAARARFVTVVLVVAVAPQILLYTLAALGAAAQQARGRFALSAGASTAENIGLLATIVVAATSYGTGTEVADAPVGLVLTLGIGSTLAVTAHAGLQLIGAARAGVPVRPSLGWRGDAEARAVTARIRASIRVAAFPQAGYFTLLALAATVPGGVVVLQVAYAVYNVPTALGARAVSTAVLPGLSGAVDRGDDGAFAASWRRAVSYVMVVSLPPLGLLVAFAVPVAGILANGELRTPSFVGVLALCVAVHAVAQLPAAIHEVGRLALFARLDLRAPRRAAAVALGVTAAVGLGSLAVPDPTGRLVWLSVATLAADLAAAVTVVAAVRSAIRPARLADTSQLRAALLAAAGMVPLLALGAWHLHGHLAGRLATFGLLACYTSAAVAVFAVTLRAGWRPRIGPLP